MSAYRTPAEVEEDPQPAFIEPEAKRPWVRLEHLDKALSYFTIGVVVLIVALNAFQILDLVEAAVVGLTRPP